MQSCAKMFWKTYLDLSPNFFSPFPQINVGYFDDPSSCNTEMTFFNIDMGEGGGEISPKFPKIFAHDCRSQVPERREVFVANRVKKIAKITEEVGIQCKYVPSEKNVADAGSRGVNLNQMKNKYWYDGPDWLLNEHDWPS